MYQQLMDCIVVCLPRATRRTADGLPTENGMPSSPRQPLNNVRMMRQFILYINADCDVPTTNGSSELHCCSPPAGHETDCRRTADSTHGYPAGSSWTVN